MILRNLNLTNFKNIASANLVMSPKLNCFVGNNGMGKSNILDAIYYLSFCKSFSGVGDAMLIRRGEDFAIISGAYTRRGIDEQIVAGLGGRRKSFKRGGKDYRKLSAHIGAFPAVLVSPSDMALVTGSGDDRRRFLDMLISQSDARYLDALIRYTRALEQRNRMLREGVTDHTLFQAVEAAMDAAAKYVDTARHRQVDTLSTLHNQYYHAIAGDGSEETALSLRTSFDEQPGATLIDILDHNRDRDRILRYTSAGPHRDDLIMTLDGMPLRRTASQGQIKTFTIALRFAQYSQLNQSSETTPLLLLDDIFDKLDASRVENIISVVASPTFGQIFITDTNRKHLDEILRRITTTAPHRLWTVSGGNATPASLDVTQ